MKLIKLGFLLVTSFMTNAMAQQLTISCGRESTVVILNKDKTNGTLITDGDLGNKGDVYKLTLKNKEDWVYEYSASEISKGSSSVDKLKVNRTDFSVSYVKSICFSTGCIKSPSTANNCKQVDTDFNPLLNSIKARYEGELKKEKMQKDNRKF